MPPTGDAYNVDWLLASSANVSIATHRDWFTNFTVFPSKLEDGSEILGVGDVHLPVRKNLDYTDERGNGVLVMKDVVLIPTFTANVAGWPVHVTEGYIFSYGNPGAIRTKNGETVAIFEATTLFKLLLSGQPRGLTSLDPNALYWVRATWPEKEWERWKEYKASSRAQGEKEDHIDENTPPYTAEEKKWLKENFGNEFHFLRQYGYSIYKDDQRAEGRRLARGMIEADARNSR